MGGIARFEEIEAWQEARDLVRIIYKQCRNGGVSRDFSLRDQLQRAGVSTMANIAEGFGRRGQRKEFIYYLRVARGSCAEIQSHAYVALDAELIDRQAFDVLYQQAQLTGRKLSGFIRYLQKNS